MKYWIKNTSTSFFYKCIILICGTFFRLFYRHKIYGLENYIQGGALVAANHVSFYDPPLVAVSCPEEMHFLARKTLFEHKFFGALIRKLNSHPVTGGASDVSVMRTILKLLKEGKKVLLFPEGTRTEGKLGEIREGLGLLAQKSDCPIIPAYIFGAEKIWPPSRKFPKLSGKTAVVFGKPIKPSVYAHQTRKEAQRQIARDFTRKMHELENLLLTTITRN